MIESVLQKSLALYEPLQSKMDRLADVCEAEKPLFLQHQMSAQMPVKLY